MDVGPADSIERGRRVEVPEMNFLSLFIPLEPRARVACRITAGAAGRNEAQQR